MHRICKNNEKNTLLTLINSYILKYNV